MVDDNGKLYTLEEAADYLGVSRRTVLRWCKEKRIDYFNVSERCFRIPEKALREFLARTRVSRTTKTQGR